MGCGVGLFAEGMEVEAGCKAAGKKPLPLALSARTEAG
jgi:hypothetical protein